MSAFVCTFPDCIHHPRPVAPTLANTITQTGLKRKERAQRAAATRRARKAEALGIVLGGAL